MVSAVRKLNIVQPVVAGNAVKRQIKRAIKNTVPRRKPVMKRVPKIDKYAKAIFNFVEVAGGTLNCTIQGEHHSFKDGDEYTRPLALFEKMNEDCRVVKRRHASGGDREGKFVTTNRYKPRLRWDIIERFDKKTMINVEDKEATAAQKQVRYDNWHMDL